MTTFERLQRLLERRLAIDAAATTPHTTLESLGLDSLARLELLFELEEAFGVRFSHDDHGVATLGDVVAALERLSPTGTCGSTSSSRSRRTSA